MTQDASNAQNVTLVLVRITAWNHDTHTESQFLWIYGPASAGKTAIAGTIAMQSWEGWLEGSFLIDMHVAVMTRHSLSPPWCINLPSAVQNFADVFPRPLRKTKSFFRGPLKLALAVRPPNS